MGRNGSTDLSGSERKLGLAPDPPEFTGERVVPDRPQIAELYREHLVRYLFAAQLCRDRVVLDAGCGVGYGAGLLGQAGARLVIGFDIAADAVAYAQARYGSRAVHFMVGDGLSFPVANHSIDLLVSFETIEHLEDAAAFVAESRRVLTPAGVALVSTPNRSTFPPGNRFHVREFDHAEFEALLRAAFPHVELWQQDIVQVHRVAPTNGRPVETPRRRRRTKDEGRRTKGVAPTTGRSVEFPGPVGCAGFDVAEPAGAAAYFVALCAARPPKRRPVPTILRTAGDAIGGLRAHWAMLIGAIVRHRRASTGEC